jgi:hypothetical protein
MTTDCPARSGGSVNERKASRKLSLEHRSPDNRAAAHCPLLCDRSAGFTLFPVIQRNLCVSSSSGPILVHRTLRPVLIVQDRGVAGGGRKEGEKRLPVTIAACLCMARSRSDAILLTLFPFCQVCKTCSSSAATFASKDASDRHSLLQLTHHSLTRCMQQEKRRLIHSFTCRLSPRHQPPPHSPRCVQMFTDLTQLFLFLPALPQNPQFMMILRK